MIGDNIVNILTHSQTLSNYPDNLMEKIHEMLQLLIVVTLN